MSVEANGGVASDSTRRLAALLSWLGSADETPGFGQDQARVDQSEQVTSVRVCARGLSSGVAFQD